VPAAAWFIAPSNPVTPISHIDGDGPAACGFYRHTWEPRCSCLRSTLPFVTWTAGPLAAQARPARPDGSLPRRSYHWSRAALPLSSATLSSSAWAPAILSGRITFGYFSPESMAQTGRPDAGQATLPQLGQPGSSAALRLSPASFSLDRRLRLVDECRWQPGGGRYGGGLVYGRKIWPRTSGIIAAISSATGDARLIGRRMYLPGHAGLCPPGVYCPKRSLVTPGKPNPLLWKYAGQVLPSHRMIQVEIHLQPHHRRRGSFPQRRRQFMG